MIDQISSASHFVTGILYRVAMAIIGRCGLLAVAGSLISAPAKSDQLRVIDGDTLRIGHTIYRLHGIDAPEAGQKCNLSNGRVWRCGAAAIAKLELLVSMGQVSCDNRGQDDYGRVIGVCSNTKNDINKQMVLEGFAWAFERYSRDYVPAQKKAQINLLGVWQAPTETPWDFRAKRWAVAEQISPDGCPIKGNISKNGRIYHAPWSPWYSRTKVSLSKGERWFCTERDAIAAGWRAPFWGK